MLPPSEIRRRGNRRRMVRHTSLVAGSLAFVAIAGFAVAQTPLLQPNMDLPGVAQPADPTASPTPEPTESPSTSDEAGDGESLKPTEEASKAPDSSKRPTSDERSQRPEVSPPPAEPKTAPKKTAEPEQRDADEATTGDPSSAPASDPTATSTAPEVVESPVENLAPRASDFGADFTMVTSARGLGQATQNSCEAGEFGNYTDVWTTEYAYTGAGVPVIGARTLKYKSVEDATAAFHLLRGQSALCKSPTGEANVMNDRSGDLPFDESAVDAELYSAAFSEGGWLTDNGMGIFQSILIVQTDDRVAVISGSFEGMDNNCTIAEDPDLEPCPVPTSLTRIAQRLSS